ncbi:MAG TPA: transglutaminase-like cysteine peptidase [Stellaceae bacterium]|nr:transglutaminase-like cysteine peptidase [Stellaceae bacterium]
MALGETAPPPPGFVVFCMRHINDCKADAQAPSKVKYSDARLAELSRVQTEINNQIHYRTEQPNNWDYSTDGRGDCNRYALGKRRALIAAGWNPEDLLLTVAITETNEAHLVLVVPTTAGDLVLDSRFQNVVLWSNLPYRWVMRQSQINALRWNSIDSHPVLTASIDAPADTAVIH